MSLSERDFARLEEDCFGLQWHVETIVRVTRPPRRFEALVRGGREGPRTARRLAPAPAG